MTWELVAQIVVLVLVTSLCIVIIKGTDSGRRNR